ncbi:hypothetical protein BDV95DRAFT_12772 [Massariosphaeria phaeospora]|uniref:Transmembrane protein n=1 Tax=Massariosphaeria phaeospora TaxID=100035 RepID=A0A7C8MVQ9_9PLEO|nr:hypothetical protein BDV95DRAFT_12772 [Massariosphaeria phaeospora]
MGTRSTQVHLATHRPPLATDAPCSLPTCSLAHVPFFPTPSQPAVLSIYLSTPFSFFLVLFELLCCYSSESFFSLDLQVGVFQSMHVFACLLAWCLCVFGGGGGVTDWLDESFEARNYWVSAVLERNVLRCDWDWECECAIWGVFMLCSMGLFLSWLGLGPCLPESCFG